MKKKYIHFILFFVAMTVVTRVAVSVGLYGGMGGGQDVYWDMTGTVICMPVALIIGYLKLGCFDDSKIGDKSDKK